MDKRPSLRGVVRAELYTHFMDVAANLLGALGRYWGYDSFRPLQEGIVRSLQPLYGERKSRMKTYREMVHAMLTEVRAGKNVCVAFYGHPGVFAWAPHEAIRIARKEGYFAHMEPGISSEDCLYADLGIDPATFGCQHYEHGFGSVVDPHPALPRRNGNLPLFPQLQLPEADFRNSRHVGGLENLRSCVHQKDSLSSNSCASSTLVTTPAIAPALRHSPMRFHCRGVGCSPGRFTSSWRLRP